MVPYRKYTKKYHLVLNFGYLVNEVLLICVGHAHFMSTHLSHLFFIVLLYHKYIYTTTSLVHGKGKHVTKHKKRKQTVYYFITYYISDQLKEIILQNNILLYIYISSLIKKKNIKSYTIKIQKIH